MGDFFSRLEASASGSSEAVLFLPWLSSFKEALEEGGIENPSLQGEKRTASRDPEAKAPKRGKKSSPEGPASGEVPTAQFF